MLLHRRIDLDEMERNAEKETIHSQGEEAQVIEKYDPIIVTTFFKYHAASSQLKVSLLIANTMHSSTEVLGNTFLDSLFDFRTQEA